MAFFLVKFIGQEGTILTKRVEAVTQEEAISLSGVSDNVIQSVVVDHFGGLRAALTDRRLPMNEQVLALITLASKLESGKTLGRAILESVDFEKLGVSREDLARCDLPAEYFKLLRFDETALLLADAGDRSGKLADSLKRAAETLKSREKTRKEFAKPMFTAVLYGIVGGAAGIGFPLFGGSMMHKFVYEQKLPIEVSKISEILMGLNTLYTTQWHLMLLAVVLGFVFKKRLWEVTRGWPVLQLFDNRTRVKRGLEFIQAYQLLTTSGYTNPMVFKFLHERSTGEPRIMYETAQQALAEGREIGEIFDDPAWPKIISQNLQGFEEQTPDGRARILENLTDALTEIFTQYSQRIASLVGKIATLVLVSSILLFALGFYVPLVTMRPGM